MKILVENLKSKVVIGGSDNLLEVDLMKELTNYLKVRPKGYQFSPLYKKHVWDGWQKFINAKGEFATGFLPLVIKFVKDLGAEVELEDLRDQNMPVLTDSPTDFVGTVDGVDYYAREKFQYQFDTMAVINNYIGDLYFPRGILDFATNAGKNSVSVLFFKNMVMMDGSPVKWVFTVSSELIYKQAVDFFQQCFPEEVIGQVNSKKMDIQRITVCMVKTLLNRAKDSVNVQKWLSEVNGLIVDESDESGTKDYSKCLSYINSAVKIFVSGTPLDSAKIQNNMTSLGLSGPVLKKISNQELIDLGVSQKPTINILLNNTDGKPLVTYEYEMENYIYKSQERVELIEEVLNKHKGEKIMITFWEITHGYFMYDYLKTKFDSIAIIHGKQAEYECDRDGDLERFKKGDLQILIASMIIKRGVNANVMRVLVRAEAGKSKTTTKQVAGRATRHDGENDEVTMYDFYDDSKTLSKHSRDRIRHYQKEGFEVKYTFEVKRGKPVKNL